MENQFQQYGFDDEILREMEKFKQDFMANQYRKYKSENQGPNYKEKVLLEDQSVFEEYLDDADSQAFLDLD